MNNKIQIGITQIVDTIGRTLFIALLLWMAFLLQTAYAQATAPTATATVGLVAIGSGNFTAYQPPHDTIHVGDSIEQAVIGNLNTGTDASGSECTLDPTQPPPVWTWTCTTTYSSDNTNYGPSDSQASIGSGQTTNLFATFASQGYYQIQFQGHVVFYTSCSSGQQKLDTPVYGENFSVDGRDFDFTVPSANSFAVNQGESGTFISQLTSINGFSGPLNFDNPNNNDKLFGVSGAGSLPTPGTAPITIHAGGDAVVGTTYPVDVRGTGNAGSTKLIHVKTVNVTIMQRGLIVTSSLGTTYYRDSKHGRQPNASAHGDTVVGTSVTYTGTPSGFWSPNSSYQWTDRLEIFDTTGTHSDIVRYFNPAPLATITGYNNPVPVANNIDVVGLSGTDADGIHSATAAGFALTFHDPLELAGLDSTVSPNPEVIHGYFYAKTPPPSSGYISFQNAGTSSDPNQWPTGNWTFTISGTLTLQTGLTVGVTAADILTSPTAKARGVLGSMS